MMSFLFNQHSRLSYNELQFVSAMASGVVREVISSVPYCYYYKRVLILANIGDLVITAKFCTRY